MLKSLKIGSLTLKHNVLLAPLAGITNLPFRILCRRYGAALAFTEMVSVNGLVRDGKKTWELLKSGEEDRPLGIQLFGEAPQDLAEAARLVEGCGQLLDINMGCPVRKVVSTGAGSALLCDTTKIAAIIRAVRAVTSMPLTIKIRSGWQCGDDTYLEVGRIAESEGCDAVTLHPRSRSKMFSGHADWSQIARLKEILSIPVIGSGDLFTAADCLKMMEETCCDGVMIARGTLGNPWIFEHVLKQQKQDPVDAGKRAAAIRQHLELFVQESSETVVISEMKKHIGWYARGFAGASEIRRTANMCRSIKELYEIAEKIAAVSDENSGGHRHH